MTYLVMYLFSCFYYLLVLMILLHVLLKSIQKWLPSLDDKKFLRICLYLQIINNFRTSDQAELPIP